MLQMTGNYTLHMKFVAGQYECPLSWIKRDHMCYIVRYDALSWPAAKLECQQVGGDLVVMNDRNTRDYIAGNVPRLLHTCK